MAIEQDLETYLNGYSPLTLLVGDRIYPVKAPTGATAPYCLYAKAEDSRLYSHDGFSGLSQVMLRLNGLATTYSTVKQVAQQLVAAMEGWPDSDSNVKAVMLTKEEDLFEESSSLYRVQVEYQIWYAG